MSKYPVELKERALNLRKRGYSVKEIAQNLNVAKGTSSLWVRDVVLGAAAQKRLHQRRLLGYYKAALRWGDKKLREETLQKRFAQQITANISINQDSCALYTALLFWCEGGKMERGTLRIINSDPQLISTFLFLLRRAFDVREHKFRVRLHLHEYHNDKRQKEFWSKTTRIPIKKFYKTFRKPHTGKRERIGYPGCATVIYHDAQLFRRLKAIYQQFVARCTGV